MSSEHDKIIIVESQNSRFKQILFNRLGSRLGGYSTASATKKTSQSKWIKERKIIPADEREGRFISYYERDSDCEYNNCEKTWRRRQRVASPLTISELHSSLTKLTIQQDISSRSSREAISKMTSADYNGNFQQLDDDLIVSSRQHASGGGSSLSLGASTTNAGDKSAHQSNKNFGKLVGKKAARLKELVLQNLGRADRTHDEMFDLYEVNFHKQQAQVTRLTKEFKVYLNALKHYQEASRGLNQCIQLSTSDYQPARHDLVCENLSQLETLNEDLMDKLQEQVVKQVGEYLVKFGEMRDKIAKRHRKLIDYDKSRRLYELSLAQINKRRAKYQQQQLDNQQQQHQENYNSILRGLNFLSQQQQQQQQQQHSTLGGQQELIASQLVDEARLLKFREQFNYCKLMYETINSELHEELPIVYEKKMKSLLTALQSYFTLEAHYHSNAGKLLSTVSDVIDEIPNCAVGIRKLNIAGGGGNASHEQDLHRRQTIIDANDDDLEDDDDDDDSYESSSNSDGHRGVSGVATIVVDNGHQLKSKGGHCSSSGLGSSSGGDSSSSASASPDCHDQSVVIVMAPDGGAKQEHQERESGKVEEPADCLIGGGDGDDGVALSAEVAEQSQQVIVSETTAAAVAAKESAGCVEGIEEVAVDDRKPISVTGDHVEEEKVVGADDDDLQIVSTSVEDPLVTIMNGDGSNVLYKVKTNYKYLAEDVDELCFEADEIIEVIEFDENQEPEEGWLMGIRQINGQRGLFPANFTVPI